MFINTVVSMANFKYRSRINIVMDILKSTLRSERGQKKTHIMENVNVNYNQVNKYLSLLISSNLMYVDDARRYRVTDRGLQFVKTLESLDFKLR
jgi:predicted transcriptional regulator